MTQRNVTSVAPSRDDRRTQMRRAVARRASLRHPHLLPARLVEDEGGARLVLQPLPAPSLRTVLKRGPLRTKNAIALVAGVAGAVDALAGAGLHAGELTPDTILVDRRRGAVLADYGIPTAPIGAKPARPDANWAYRSPEEREGRAPTARSSVYSLGAILVSTLTGAPAPEQLQPRQARRTRDVPPTIESVIAQAMEADPSRRYANVMEMARAATEVVRASDRIGRMRAPAPDAQKPRRMLPWSAAQGRGTKRAKPVAATAGNGAAPAKELADDHIDDAARRKADEADRAVNAHRAEQRKVAEGDERRAKAEQRKRAQTAAKRERAAAKRERENAAAEHERDERAARSERAESAKRNATAAAKQKGAPATRRRGVDTAQRQRKRQRGAAAAASASRAPRGGSAGALIPTIRLGRGGSPRGFLSRRALPLVGMAIVAGAGGVSTLALTGGSDELKPVQISAADLSIRIPAGWERTEHPARRLSWLSSGLGAAASDGGRGALVTGLIREPAAGRRALRALMADGGTAKTVRLGDLEAERYSGLHFGDGLAGTAYVIHTTGPSIAMVCRGANVAHTCAAAAATVALRGERPVSPSVAARRPLLVRRALRKLSAERAAGRRQVAAALVADDQAKASRALQASYLQAAAQVDLSGAYGSRIDALGAALRDASDAYGKLAGSISASDQRAYDAARAAVLEAETEIWGPSASN